MIRVTITFQDSSTETGTFTHVYAETLKDALAWTLKHSRSLSPVVNVNITITEGN